MQMPEAKNFCCEMAEWVILEQLHLGLPPGR